MREAIQVNGFLLVEVPGHSKSFDLDFGGKNVICHGEYVDAAYIETPAGNYEIIGLLREIAERDLSEKEWQEISKAISEHSLSPDCLILKKNL